MRQASRRKYHYIYKIVRFDGKYYIGMHSTDNLDDGYFGSGKRLRHSIKKHGKDKHQIQILAMYEDRENLRLAESRLVDQECLNDPMCMNLRLGGEGGWDHVNASLTSEKRLEIVTKAGFATSNRLKTDTELFEKFQSLGSTIASRAKQRGTKFGGSKPGRVHSEETKQKMSESSKGTGLGSSNSQFGTCWINNGQTVLKIKLTELSSFLSEGWKRGRRIMDNVGP